MPCIHYTASKNPNNATLVKNLPEYQDFVINSQEIGAAYGISPVWDLKDLPAEFFLDGLDPATVSAVLIPDYSKLEEIRTAIQSHALTAAVKQYNLSNNIVPYRKVVDADTQQILIDWEPNN